MNINSIVRTFASESKLIEWLDDKRWDCESPEEFNEWLNIYFEDGNEIIVNGKSYDYLDCVELI